MLCLQVDLHESPVRLVQYILYASGDQSGTVAAWWAIYRVEFTAA
jgi:hypothetical protein